IIKGEIYRRAVKRDLVEVCGGDHKIELEFVAAHYQLVGNSRRGIPAPVERQVVGTSIRVHLTSGARKQLDAAVRAVAQRILFAQRNAGVHGVPAVDDLIDLEHDVVLPLVLRPGETEARRVQAVPNVKAIGKRGGAEEGLDGLVQTQMLRIIRGYVIC